MMRKKTAKTNVLYRFSGGNASIRTFIALVVLLCLSGQALAQNVGIGTNTPIAKLHIEVPSGFSSPVLQVNQQGAATPYLIILPNGNVGIGVATPSEALDVNGNMQFSGALMPGGNPGSAGQVLVSQGPGTAPQWVNSASIGDNWGSQVAQTQAPIVGNGTAGSPIGLQSGTSAGDVLIYNGSTWVIKQAPWDSVCNTATANMVQKWTGSQLCNSQIYDDGTNVGIGTTTPSEKLDVNGNVQFSGALMPGGNPGSAGQVLVSQGPGTPPTWQYLSSPGVGSCVRNVTPCVNTSGGTGSCPSMTLSQCANACKNSTYGGFTDWRVPTIEEYFCLKTEGYSFDNASQYYWTSTPLSCVSYPCTWATSGHYYIFRPSDGGWGWASTYGIYCRCVR